MRRLQSIVPAAAALLLLVTGVNAQTSTVSGGAQVSAQTPSATSTMERGYRTGYSDGYPAGFADSQAGSQRDFRSKTDYRRADRAFQASYGDLEDYRDGYQQGFEAGYNSGYDRRTFDSTVPANLARRGATTDDAAESTPQTVITNPGNSDNSSSSGVSVSTSGRNQQPQTAGGALYIPAHTELVVEMLNRVNSEVSQRGDRFQARVVSPNEWQGAIIEGH